jgi:hypothetical protein
MSKMPGCMGPDALRFDGECSWESSWVADSCSSECSNYVEMGPSRLYVSYETIKGDFGRDGDC